MDTAFYLLPTLLCYAFGVVGALIAGGRASAARVLCFGAAALGGLSGTVAAVMLLGVGTSAPASSLRLLPALTPYVQFTIRVDPLGVFFVLVLSLLALALGIYSLGYSQAFAGRKNLGLFGALFNLLLLATTLVFLAGNAVFFLVVWELMALAAFCLVSFEHEQVETRKAGVFFFIMSHLGTGCLLLGFLLLAQGGTGFDFGQFQDVGERLSPRARDVAFLLFLVGFGVKAGLVPLHLWLPAAHPVAPSNVSALMSGVIIKTGIYGMARVFFDFMGEPPMWWAVTLLGLGAASAVLGVLYALMEHDLKRLLAYHSIENIGIILMGLGASLFFLHTGHALLAGLALIAGLYHTLNHATFKGLLFLGAGAVLHATHTRNMEEHGGLIKRMPQTALFFLIGAVAISALPPLNGFVSEWLTYQALLQGFGTTSSLVRLVLPFSGAILALTGALAAACFVKAFGITFLAQPRSQHAAKAHEATPTMRAGMALLAGACVFLGLFPTVFLRLLDPVTDQLIGVTLSERLTLGGGFVLSGVKENAGSVSTLGLMAGALCLLPIPLALWWVLGRKTRIHRGPTWDCGLQGLTPQMEYTATGFSKPLRMIFKALFRPRREVQAEYDYSPYFARTLRFESRIEEAFERRLYRPFNHFVLRVSRFLRRLQAGSMQAYLIYIFVTLLVLLTLFAL